MYLVIYISTLSTIDSLPSYHILYLFCSGTSKILYECPLVIKGSRRSCFASKALELCRDVNKEKKGHVDSKFKIQKFGGKIRQKKIQNIANRDGECCEFSPPGGSTLCVVKSSPFFVVYIAA